MLHFLTKQGKKGNFLYDIYFIYIREMSKRSIKMLFVKETVKSEELNTINNFFAELDNEFDSVKTIQANEEQEPTNVSLYITSLVSNQYQKSIEDIQNTKVGNKIKRKRNLQQVMQESFFYGANRFGNNFIA